MDNGDVLKASGERKTELKGDMTALKTELKTDMTALEERLREYVHDTETRIVGEFFHYAQSMDARLRTTEVNILPMIDRMAAMDTRLLSVERRLNLPSQQ